MTTFYLPEPSKEKYIFDQTQPIAYVRLWLNPFAIITYEMKLKSQHFAEKNQFSIHQYTAYCN